MSDQSDQSDQSNQALGAERATLFSLYSVTYRCHAVAGAPHAPTYTMVMCADDPEAAAAAAIQQAGADCCLDAHHTVVRVASELELSPARGGQMP